MKINGYLLFALVFFFLNSLGLPSGLTYTALLSPFLYWYAMRARRKEILLPFILAITPFVIAQLLSGVDIKIYFVSLLYYASVYIFIQAAYAFLQNCPDLEGVIRKILIINFIFCLLAIPLYFTPIYDIFWLEQYLTKGVNNFRRFKLFTYEPSYYATLFIPIFFFYFLRIILRQNRSNSWLLLLMIILPLVLSFSLGVISAIAVAILLTFFLQPVRLLRKKRVMNLLVFVGSGTVLVFLALFIFYPNNPLFIRIVNVFSGKDLSGKGRTSDAFVLANRILSLKQPVWGIGPGQIKIIGKFTIREFYAYPNADELIGIPNAVAETLVIFGWAGLFVRFALEFFFFFRTRVWSNYFRLSLFLFMFVYQFSASFITSLAEYLIWLLAFVNVFPQFDVAGRKAVHPTIAKPLPDV